MFWDVKLIIEAIRSFWHAIRWFSGSKISSDSSMPFIFESFCVKLFSIFRVPESALKSVLGCFYPFKLLFPVDIIHS